MAVTGFGDCAARLGGAARVLAWYQAQVGHQLRCTGKALQIADLGDDGARCQETDAT
jgi:hypothetical protein